MVLHCRAALSLSGDFSQHALPLLHDDGVGALQSDQLEGRGSEEDCNELITILTPTVYIYVSTWPRNNIEMLFSIRFWLARACPVEGWILQKDGREERE
jgi:hypothetical protein